MRPGYANHLHDLLHAQGRPLTLSRPDRSRGNLPTEMVSFELCFTNCSSCFAFEQAEPAVLGYVVFEFNLSGQRMPGPASSIDIDNVHCRAICDEIGYRLRLDLQGESPGLPPKLAALLEQLQRQDLAAAPSIAPSLDDLQALETTPA